jgi:hypothetical protein
VFCFLCVGYALEVLKIFEGKGVLKKYFYLGGRGGSSFANFGCRLACSGL